MTIGDALVHIADLIAWGVGILVVLWIFCS